MSRVASSLDTAEGQGLRVLESVEADFEKMTWTFRLGINDRVAAGNYAVWPVESHVYATSRRQHAEGLLRRVLSDGLTINAQTKEAIEKFFDPAL